MATAVWTWQVEYPVKVRRAYEEVRLPLGSGNNIQIGRDIAWTHATGYRGTASYGGRSIFQVRLRIAFGDWDDVLGFLQARKDDGAAFYWYNAHENSVTSTWTGDTSSGPTNDPDGLACTNVTGRYLVRQFGDIEYTIPAGRMVEAGLEFEEVIA